MVPNTSDDEGRYAYSRQPDVARQNLHYLAQALAPVLNTQQQDAVQRVCVWERVWKIERRGRKGDVTFLSGFLMVVTAVVWH